MEVIIPVLPATLLICDNVECNTYGSLCELMTAGHFLSFIEVYLNGKLNEKFDVEGSPVKRFHFSSIQNLSYGHFDVYLHFVL